MAASGKPNLAPFSCVHAESADPPYVMFAPNAKGPGIGKDIFENLRDAPEFVVRLVSVADAATMNPASFP